MIELEFPEGAFIAVGFMLDAITSLVKITNLLITNNKGNEQKELEERLSKEIQYHPTFLIDKGAIVEVAPTSMHIRGKCRELTKIVMPLYRINRNGILTPYIEDLDERAKMHYKTLKGNFDPPVQIAEAIPALSKFFSCKEIDKLTINLKIKRYAAGEGKEKLVEEYGVQLSEMVDSYHEAQKPKQQFQKLDMEAILKENTDTQFIESMLGKEQKSETDELYEALARVPCDDSPSITRSKSPNHARKPFES